ncbi:MAG: sulfite exporter TauE/SafE family protein [Actinomycetota bacterium]|nr:sulfite exporter TauE/SafE family protein [Actinomycetota bacterium]
MLEVAVLAAVAAWCFVVAVAGGLVGLVLGNLRLPLLVLAASTPAAGAGANIGISAIAAATAAVTHVSARRVNWRLAAWLIPPSVAGALAGGALSGTLPERGLLILIGVLLLVFGFDLLRRRRDQPRPQPRERPDVAAAVVTGAAVGFLGGLVGLILGSLRLPALLRYVGERPARAVGTNLVAGFFVGAAGVIGHLPGGVEWDLLGVGAAASIPGALLGARLTGRLDDAALLRAIGAVLVCAGIATVAQSLVP